MKTDEKPYSEWDTNDLLAEYARLAREYGLTGMAGPDEYPNTFRYADKCLSGAQDIRDELYTRGVNTIGYLFPTRGA